MHGYNESKGINQMKKPENKAMQEYFGRTDAVYTHNPKGGRYTVVGSGKVKIDDGEWLPSITYRSIETGELYTRTESDFNDKFKIIE
jgi:hypothetical protein